MFENLKNAFKPKENVEKSASEDLAKKGLAGAEMKETIPESFMEEARKAIILRIKLYNEGSAKEQATTDLIKLLQDPIAKEKYITNLARKMMEEGKEGVMKEESFQSKY